MPTGTIKTFLADLGFIRPDARSGDIFMLPRPVLNVAIAVSGSEFILSLNPASPALKCEDSSARQHTSHKFLDEKTEAQRQPSGL